MKTIKKILLKTGAVMDPTTGKVKSSSGVKYNTLIKPIYEEYYKEIPLPTRRTSQPSPLSPAPRRMSQPSLSPSLTRVPAKATLLPPPKTGKGVVFLPSDPNALVEMLPIRFASYKAGNSGVVDEIVAICDELLRQGELDKEKYKAIMSRLIK